MGRKPKEGKKVGKYLRRRIIRIDIDRVKPLLEKLIEFFDGKGNTKEIKMNGLTGLIKLWDKGCHSTFLKWLDKNGAIEDLGWNSNSCFGGREKIKKIKKKMLKELLKAVKESEEKYIEVYF